MPKKQSKIDIEKLENTKLETLLKETRSRYRTYVKTSYSIVEQLSEYTKNLEDQDECFSFDVSIKNDSVNYGAYLMDEHVVDKHEHTLQKFELLPFDFRVEHCNGYTIHNLEKGDQNDYAGCDKLSILYNNKPVFEAIVYERKLKSLRVPLCKEGEWQGEFSKFSKGVNAKIAEIIDKRAALAAAKDQERVKQQKISARRYARWQKAETLRQEKKKAYEARRKELFKEAEHLGVYTPAENS
jgi:hypothetical protein